MVIAGTVLTMLTLHNKSMFMEVLSISLRLQLYRPALNLFSVWCPHRPFLGFTLKSLACALQITLFSQVLIFTASFYLSSISHKQHPLLIKIKDEDG